MSPGAVAGTRERLLDAGAEVFAEKGYRRGSVREIVRRAGGANAAAVGYHFGGKQAFYAAVLEHEMRAGLEKYPAAGNVREGAPAEERLRAFVEAFLHRVLDPGLSSRMGRLMAREMIDPTPALRRVVEAVIRPLFRFLCALLGELLPAGVGKADRERAARSVVGQILFYRHAAAVLERLGGRPDGVPQLAEHISSLTLGGLRALGGARTGGRP
jgi:AcrR family transcriptional regulator